MAFQSDFGWNRAPKRRIYKTRAKFLALHTLNNAQQREEHISTVGETISTIRFKNCIQETIRSKIITARHPDPPWSPSLQHLRNKQSHNNNRRRLRNRKEKLLCAISHFFCPNMIVPGTPISRTRATRRRAVLLLVTYK